MTMDQKCFMPLYPFAFPNVDFAMGIQKIKDLELLNYAAKFTSISELWYEY